MDFTTTDPDRPADAITRTIGHKPTTVTSKAAVPDTQPR